MLEGTLIYELLGRLLPFESMQMRFMQMALVGLLLLAPMAGAMGVLVVNLRMSFFAEAISHSTFTGVALGLLLAVSPHWTTPLFALVLGLCVMAVQDRTRLPTDAVIGVFLAGVVAFGLAVVSRDPNLARNIQGFLYGDILSISGGDIRALLLLAIGLAVFLHIGYNRMLYIGLNPVLARAHRVPVAMLQYVFAGFLAVLVVFTVRAAGVIMAPGLFIIPAAAARNFSRSAGRMLWWAVLVSASSALLGLLISVQDWARTATGATVVLVAFAWFLASCVVAGLRNESSK